MHDLNNFVPAQCFLLLVYYPDTERVIWMRSGNSKLAYPQAFTLNSRGPDGTNPFNGGKH